MTIETEDMRLQFMKDFWVIECTFTYTSAGTIAAFKILLQKYYVEEEVEGEVDMESYALFAFVRNSDVPNIQQGDSLAISSGQISIKDRSGTYWAWERGIL